MNQLPPRPYPSVVTTGLVSVSVIFPVLSAISIFLRFLARRSSTQPLRADDYWIVGSWFLTLGLSILVWHYTTKTGINNYRDDVDFLSGTESSLELVFISSCYLPFPLAAVKIAVLLFYKRVFTTPMFKAAVWFTIGVVSLWAWLFFFLILFEIDPISFPLTMVKLRFDTAALGLGQAASSFALDVLVLCLPLPVIFKLNMKWERKVAVALIFWLGAFCAVAAIVRTALLDESIRKVVSSASYSQVSSQSKQYIFQVLEPNCSIIAACLPTYGPLISGGRAPESIVRSVRSIFSLRSAGSRGASRSNGSLPRSGTKSAAESQVELHGVENWPGKGRQEIKIEGDVPPLPNSDSTKQGINVTNGVSVYRE